MKPKKFKYLPLILLFTIGFLLVITFLYHQIFIEANQPDQQIITSTPAVVQENSPQQDNHNHQNHQHENHNHNHNHNHQSYRHRSTSSSRVAVIVPYVGATLPSWFQSFLFTAQFSSTYFDWMIFVTTKQNISTPSNVHLIYITEKELASRIVKMDSSPSFNDQHEFNYDYWSNQFLDLLHLVPYMLVEYKPALGWIFEDYIVEYSHWAFADLDILVGRVSSFLSEEIFENYDVYTSSFADSNRMYMRGQLTIFRNNYFINNLWRQCPYFSKITFRLKNYFQSEHQLDSKTKGWRFQSAEGCISKVVTDQTNLTIYVGSTQITDAFHADVEEKESIIIGSALMRCYNGPIEIPLLVRSNVLGGGLHRYPRNVSAQIIKLEVDKNPSCAYWIDSKYQVCISDSQPTKELDITWKGPQNVIGQHVSYEISRTNGNSYCREGMISHFQGWKDIYYGYTTRPPSLDTHSFLLTQFGFIPLRIKNLAIENSLPTMKEVLDLYSQQNSYEQIFTGQECNGRYCLKYNSKLKNCLSYLTCEDITYTRVGQSNLTKVTLILVGDEDSISSGAFDQTIRSWTGEMVIVIQYLHTVSADTLTFIKRMTRSSTVHLKSLNDRKQSFSNKKETHQFPSISIVLVATQDSSLPLLDKTLFNIGMDLSLTDSVLLSHPGFVFSSAIEQSLARSLQSSLLAFIIPVFLSTHVGQLFQMSAGNLQKFCGFDDVPESLFLTSSSVEMIQQSKEFIPIPNSVKKEYFGSHSFALPVAWNMKSCEHGSSFIRYPMELNGKYCYGTSLYSILEGAGYSLTWFNQFGTFESTYLQKKRPNSPCETCQYEQQNYDSFIRVLKRYLIRSRSLRERGVESVHTKNDLGYLY